MGVPHPIAIDPIEIDQKVTVLGVRKYTAAPAHDTKTGRYEK